MIDWVLRRVVDILLALVVMALVLWYLLTQPIFSFSAGASPDLGLKRNVLEMRLREIVAVGNSESAQPDRFLATANYLRNRFEAIGAVEQIERGDNLQIFRLKAGEGERKLFVGMHYVVTEKPILEVATTTVSLLALAQLVEQSGATGRQLDLTIFLHRLTALRDGLIDATIYHTDQIKLTQSEQDRGILFAPGLKVPGAVYVSDQWRYFDFLLPSTGSELSLFGRLRDIAYLRRLKLKLREAGLESVNSLSIPSNFYGLDKSPLRLYWEQDIPAVLMRPNILVHDSDFYGHIKFISSLYGLLSEE